MTEAQTAEASRLFALIPREAGGWTSAGADQVFDRDTIFDYIDGSGEVYRAFDMRLLASRRFSKTGQADVIVDFTNVPAGSYVLGNLGPDEPFGGGIPIIENDKGEFEGVEAVIDKDLASALFASSISADMFLISTEVEKVAINFNKPDVQWLDKLTVEDANKYLAEGQFGKGSMEPKVKAVLNFLEWGGKKALITNPDNMLRALRGETGTHFGG